jgi:biotin carboxyl carrier protein
VPVEDERTRETSRLVGGPRKATGPAEVRSVMPGVVKEVRVAPGDAVEAHQPLLVLEAMKMENEIRADRAGVVREVHVKPGQAVEKGARLVSFGPASK